MGRIADILTKARDSLADSSSDRFTDARLLRLVDEAQKDITKEARLLRKTELIHLVDGYATYELEADSIYITRITHNDTGEEIHFRSRDWMDKYDAEWETRTGSKIEFIVYDKLEPKQIRTYPILDGVSDDETFVTSDFGMVTAVSGDIIGFDFGVVTGVTEDATKTQKFSSIWGVVTGMLYTTLVLKAHYLERPSTIDAIDTTDSSLEISHLFDKAIKHYVIGMALIDDKDTQSVALGKDHMSVYVDEVKKAKNLSDSHFVSNPKQHSTVYNGGFEDS